MTIIRVFLGLASCTLEQLGYDPTIRWVAKEPEDNVPTFHIDVGTNPVRTFRTRRIISDYGADTMCGRGTRIWAVVETTNLDGPEYALKDCWVDHDRPREGGVLQELYHIDLGNTTRAERQAARRHFLTLVTHGDVPMGDKSTATKSLSSTTESSTDSTLMIMRRGIKLTCNNSLVIRRQRRTTNPPTSRPSAHDPQKHLSTPATGSKGNLPQLRHAFDAVEAESTIDRDLNHYRVVFTEVGQSLYSLKSFSDIFKAILGAVSGGYHVKFHRLLNTKLDVSNSTRMDAQVWLRPSGC
jgi:hypothetical protein